MALLLLQLAEFVVAVQNLVRTRHTNQYRKSMDSALHNGLVFFLVRKRKECLFMHERLATTAIGTYRPSWHALNMPHAMTV